MEEEVKNWMIETFAYCMVFIAGIIFALDHLVFAFLVLGGASFLMSYNEKIKRSIILSILFLVLGFFVTLLFL